MIALWLGLAFGHPLAPSVLRIADTPSGIEAVWRTPVARPAGLVRIPQLPCDPVEEPVVRRDGLALETRWLLSCSSLDGRTAGVDGLRPGEPAVLLQWEVDGHRVSNVLGPEEPRVAYRATSDSSTTLWETVWLGVEHLFGGADHLLFVGGLVLAVPRRDLLAAITAFTAGHAISLALAGTRILTLPSGLVELAIAASLVWLAAELLGDEESSERWLSRHPVWLCLPFGLVHGLGFAGAWLESGMATDPMAIAGFNLGIEVAQLTVIGGLLAVFAWLGTPGERGRFVLAGIGGVVAAAWVWERALVLL